MQKLEENGQHVPNRIQSFKFLPGRTNFYWNEERLMCYIILISIVIGYFLFMINDAKFSIEHYTFLVPVGISAIFLTTIVNQLLASFGNPGIMSYQNESNVSTLTEISTKSNNNGLNNDQEILVPVKLDGTLTLLKYCHTCKLLRPPRAAHCRFCDICVYRSDHHCPYLGNCIGLKNYKNFYYFLLSVVLLTACGFGFALLHLLHLKLELGTFQNALYNSPISALVMSACVLGGSFPFGLLCFHTYILLNGITSREMLKKIFKNKRNPYSSRNPLVNCYITLCCTGKPNNVFEYISDVAEHEKQDFQTKNG